MLNFQGVLGPQNVLVLKSFQMLYLGIIQKEATSIFGELPLMVQKSGGNAPVDMADILICIGVSSWWFQLIRKNMLAKLDGILPRYKHNNIFETTTQVHGSSVWVLLFATQFGFYISQLVVC